MYAALGCRPDIAYAVTTLSRFNAAPLQFHMTAAYRVLRYLKATKSLGIRFTRTSTTTDARTSMTDLSSEPRIIDINACQPNPEAYKYITAQCDSDWGGCGKDRKSIGGMVFFHNEAPISW